MLCAALVHASLAAAPPMQTAIMLMEALAGFEHKFDYAIVGHSGSGPQIPLVRFGTASARSDRFGSCGAVQPSAQSG